MSAYRNAGHVMHTCFLLPCQGSITIVDQDQLVPSCHVLAAIVTSLPITFVVAAHPCPSTRTGRQSLQLTVAEAAQSRGWSFTGSPRCSGSVVAQRKFEEVKRD